MLQDFVMKHGEKRPVGKHRRRWEESIKMDLQEVDGAHGLD
jgi:hypothetical protein